MKQFLFAAAADQAVTPPTTDTSAPDASAANTPTITTAPAAGDAGEQVSATEIQPTDTDAAPAQKQPQGGGFGWQQFFPIIIIFAIFYFLMIKPQQRKEKERRKMISELRAGARVVFAGGLLGTIVEAKEATFKIEIAGDVVIEVARNAVQGLAAEDAPAGSAK